MPWPRFLAGVAACSLLLLPAIAGAQTGTISGTITAAPTGDPLEDIEVDIYAENGSPVGFDFTDAAGFYSVSALQPGTYFVVAKKFGDNYLEEVYDNVRCTPICPITSGTPVVVPAGATIGGINVALDPGGRVTGVVVDAVTGTPVAATVHVVGVSPGSSSTITQTQISGVYEVQGLLTGTYVAQAVPQAQLPHIRELFNNRPCVSGGCVLATGDPFTVTAGATTSAIDFHLEKWGRIQGVVTHAPTGFPLPGVVVRIRTLGGALVGDAVSAGFGIYVRDGLAPGSYTVEALTAGTALAPPTVQTVSVAIGATTTADFALVPTISTGTIVGAVFGPQGGGLPHQPVLLRQLDGTVVSTYGTEDGTGHEGPPAGYFIFSGLQPGTYLVHFGGGAGYLPEAFDNIPCNPGCAPTDGSPITVLAGWSSGIAATLSTSGGINGHVSDAATTAPLAGVAVNVHRANGSLAASVQTDVNGNYAAPLVAGSYYVRTANTLGYRDETFDDQPFCVPSCAVTSGQAVSVVGANWTPAVDFALAARTELVENGTFASGLTHWGLFATPDLSYILWNASNGVFRFARVPPPPGTINQAVLLQHTGALVASGTPVIAQFDLANTGTLRRRITVLVHDSDFSDLATCTFWLAANASRTRYGMRVHTTKAWANATIAFYAASVDASGGFYEIDNVSMQVEPAAPSDRTDCLDPLAPVPAGGPAGPDMLVNGDFAAGALSPGWATFGQIQGQVSAGVFEFVKVPGTPAGVLLQETGQSVGAGHVLTATFDLGNSSTVRKRVVVILHDKDFSDLSVCVFWIPPGQTLAPYTYRTFATEAWANATVSIYPATTGDDQWIRLDNVTLAATPSAAIGGTECVEPGSGSDRGWPTGRPIRPQQAAVETPQHHAADGSRAVVRTGTAGAAGAAGVVFLSLSNRSGTIDLQPAFAVAGTRIEIQVSVDGTVWETLGVGTTSDGGASIEVDLSAYAGRAVFLRIVSDGAAPGGTTVSVWRIAVE